MAHRKKQGKGLFAALALLSLAPLAAQTPTELFLSEYVEGSSNNKALEIANPRGYVGLQAETGTVEFRSVEIRELISK